ncbi:MAG TPA: cytochrome c [Thermoanaerobaculia bacterium]|nr:cytochrome c [Thermoanaerobaculia bacterium]
MRTVLALLVSAALLVVAALAFIYSGLYDVAASAPDAGVVGWALGTIQSRSVHRRAEEVAVPPLGDPAMIRQGLVLYHEMCAACHGAPGVAISAIGQGLNPPPPELASEAEEPGELFWVTKHGIKMTGMPAFGVTLDDEELWAIVAFLQKMPEMSPEEYQAAVRAAGPAPPL